MYAPSLAPGSASRTSWHVAGNTPSPVSPLDPLDDEVGAVPVSMLVDVPVAVLSSPVLLGPQADRTTARSTPRGGICLRVLALSRLFMVPKVVRPSWVEYPYA